VRDAGLGALACCLLVGCAAQAPLIKQTASAYPQGVFKGQSLEEVKAKIMDACISIGAMVSEASSNQVVCGKAMEGGQAALTQVLIGNAYSTTPQQKIRFVMYVLNSNVKVTAQEWVETQMPGGQLQTVEIRNNNEKNGIQRMLFRLGAE